MSEDLVRNNDTLMLAVREADVSLQTLARWYDGLDGKVVAVFSVASAIVGFAPSLAALRGHPVNWALWIIALAAWLASASACVIAFWPKTYRLDPHPKVLLNDAWLSLSQDNYHYFRLEDMAESYRVNRQAYRTKVRALTAAIVATAVEVLALSIALFVAGRP